MRTVSFSNAKVQNALNHNFVCCFTNTQGDPSAGASFAHAPSDAPGPCARGAGRQNVQTIFLTPAGEIFHVATGYLDPDELLTEAAFALQLYADLQRSGGREPALVAAHGKRLRQLGFSSQQIDAPANPLTDMMLSGPNPQDFGIRMPKPQDFGVNLGGKAGGMFEMFGDVTRQRMLKDHRFVMANPLLSYQAFDNDPRSLVGHHQSFFGSNAAMNGIGPAINSQLDHSLGAPSRRRR